MTQLIINMINLIKLFMQKAILSNPLYLLYQTIKKLENILWFPFFWVKLRKQIYLRE